MEIKSGTKFKAYGADYTVMHRTSFQSKENIKEIGALWWCFSEDSKLLGWELFAESQIIKAIKSTT
jgi:hypothetical protein